MDSISINKIKDNLNKRLILAEKRFDDLRNNKVSKDLVEKMMEFHDLSLINFSSFFRNVTGQYGITTLEGLEGFNSFVGLFLDDFYYTIKYDQCSIDMVNNINRIKSETTGKEFKPINPSNNMEFWFIDSRFDNEDFVSKNALMDILNNLIKISNKIK